jgi:hypothetical protein
MPTHLVAALEKVTVTTYGGNNATPTVEVYDNGLDVGKLNF